MIHRYTVVGNPVEHSLSPRIHTLFAEQTQRTIEYSKTLATENNFSQIVDAFFAGGGTGCNITVPFKQRALELCTSLSPAAERARAVNTIKVHADGSLCGHNTDGSGLVRDLTINHKLELQGATILIAGAGGSTRGILAPLLNENPEKILIANRTLSTAAELAVEFGDLGHVAACEYSKLPRSPFTLVLNATSLSLQGQKPDIPADCIDGHSVAYDLMYGQDTPFLQWTHAAGAAKSVDGIGMLLEQAADAFFLWEEVRPKTRLVLAKL